MIQTTKVQLSGLTCNACEKVIANRLNKIADVQEVRVQAQDGATTILASRAIRIDEIQQALANTHYNVITNNS